MTYWFRSEDKALANYRNMKAIGKRVRMGYDHWKDMFWVKVV